MNEMEACGASRQTKLRAAADPKQSHPPGVHANGLSLRYSFAYADAALAASGGKVCVLSL